MKRRDFLKSPAALVATVAVPSAVTALPTAVAAMPETRSPETLPDIEVTHVRVGHNETGALRSANFRARQAGLPQPAPEPPDDESNYWAEAIRLGDRHFYRVGSTMVKCSAYDCKMVIANPTLYYFTRALWLHIRIQRKRDGVPDPIPDPHQSLSG